MVERHALMSNRDRPRYGSGRLIGQLQHGGRRQNCDGLRAAVAGVREHMQGIAIGVASGITRAITLRIAVGRRVGVAVLVGDVVICRGFAGVLEVVHFTGPGQHRRDGHGQCKHRAEHPARKA